jgi:glycerophosphoryl diester phosphodiesterase
MIAVKRRQVGRTLHAPPCLDRRAFVRPIAHRGLHDREKRRIENTAPAFAAAIEADYGIECDLQATLDDVPIVFHDARLDRLVAASGATVSYSSKALASLRYKDSSEAILSFADLLDLVDGRVPLLVEVKGNRNGPRVEFLKKISQHAQGYKGPVALMSFERPIVAAFGEFAPRVPRGPVVGSQQFLAGLWGKASRAEKARVAPRLFGLGPESGSFYAVDIRLVALARAWMTRQALDVPLFTWTVRTPRQRAAAARWADAPIFEGYEA